MDRLPVNTKAGIEWIKHSIPVCMKYLVGRKAEQHVAQRGSITGWRSAANERHLEEYIRHMIPDCYDYFTEHSSHVGGTIGGGQKGVRGLRPKTTSLFSQVLSSRGYNCFIYDELARWRQPQWEPLTRRLETALETEKPVEPWLRFAAHQEIVRVQIAGLPGVYVLQSASNSEIVYVGSAKDMASRVQSHISNSDLYLFNAYPTGNEPVARQLEQSIHERIAESGIVVEVAFPKQSVGKQGRYRLERGVEGGPFVNLLVNTHYRHFCRGTVKGIL